jgi:hypothetical protein
MATDTAAPPSDVQDPPDETTDDLPTGELVIDAGGQLTLNVGGGKQPTTATLRLSGGKIEVDGQSSCEGRGIVVRDRGRVVNEMPGSRIRRTRRRARSCPCERRHKGSDHGGRGRLTGRSSLVGKVPVADAPQCLSSQGAGRPFGGGPCSFGRVLRPGVEAELCLAHGPGGMGWRTRNGSP